MRILVTGASGFIGRRLCVALAARGADVVAVVREATQKRVPGGSIEVVTHGDFSATTDWGLPLREVDAVIHLAGRAHRSSKNSAAVYKAFERTNVHATLALAKQCIKADVKRFVYISSVKAAGERSGQQPLTEDITPRPEDAYGKTKLEAEALLLALEGLQTVILRPPLVYGPAVRGNFLWLLRLAKSGLPVPLGCAFNQRSMIYLENLVDCLMTCAQNPRATGVYFVADAELLSVKELFTRLSLGFGKTPRFFCPPPAIFRTGARLFGMKPAFDRIFDPLIVSTSKIEVELGWYPPIRVDEGLKKTAEAFTGALGESCH